MRILFHNPELESLHVPGVYRRDRVDTIEQALRDRGALQFAALSTGLYPASSAGDLGVSGYGNVWVRDNVFVAFALQESGSPAAAAAVASGLLRFYNSHRHRFDNGSHGDVMGRPHVRFNGQTLQEITGESWPHAQNDALGYCLWLCARMARLRLLTLDASGVDTLAAMAGYFAALRYWEDEDSGHWEETRKISASSIGAVVAGLREWRLLLEQESIAGAAGKSRAELIAVAEHLIVQGQSALAAILPAECAQLSPHQNRRFDAALLFLVYPLGVIEGPMSDLVVSDVRRYLLGDVGIRRYLRDSYWAPDYDTRLAQGDLTRDYSNDMETRDQLLECIGDEAQWCVFDPMVSALYGHRVLATGAAADREAQTWHFNRSLAHISAEWHCPELYYRRDGALVSNPHSPLLWTQANVLLALAAMRRTAECGVRTS